MNNIILSLSSKTVSSTAGGNEGPSGFVGSPAFIAIIGVVIAIPVASFFIMLLILCCICLWSSNVNCSCPKLDCDDCCNSLFKSLSCGVKWDDLNPVVICLFVILGIFAAPVVIVFGAVGIAIYLIGACLLYSIAHICDN